MISNPDLSVCSESSTKALCSSIGGNGNSRFLHCSRLRLSCRIPTACSKKGRNTFGCISAAIRYLGRTLSLALKIAIIREVNTDSYWEANDILVFEKTRRELRDLMKFLVDDAEPKKRIITNLTDPVIDTTEGKQLDPAYDFEDYKKKVNRYVNEHGNSIVIHKLTHNIPLTAGDYEALERVLTEELGSKEDYKREYGDTPFGLLIRKIAKLDHDAAMEAFSAFINDASLNQKQIAFVRKIINHMEQSGYMEDIKELMKPPFDKPISFVKLFDAKTRTALMKKIIEIKENAVNIVA